MKKRIYSWILMIMTALICLSLMMPVSAGESRPDSYGGPGNWSEDDWYDDGGWDEAEDEWDEDWLKDWDDWYAEEDDWYDDGGWEMDSSGSGSGENASGEQVDEEELETWNTGIGSAGRLDGRIVVVSLFTDDARTSWKTNSREDQALKADCLSFLEIALDWICENAAKWGYTPEFIYDWNTYPELSCEVSIRCDVTDDYDDPTEEMDAFIQKYVPSEQLLRDFDAESILYLSFVNTPLRNDAPSFTIPYYDSSETPVEICYFLMGCDGERETPAAFAHEILHAFGAPDLYTSEDPAYNYNIDDTFVRYCEVFHPNEIMMTTYDVNTDESYYDHISNELTEITAYYIGWTDECEEVERFHLQKSQYQS